MERNAQFAGVVLDTLTGRIRFGKESGSVLGVHARVETAGEIDRRVTATRLALTGPLAYAFRKKKDRSQACIFIEGDGFAWAVPFSPNQIQGAWHFLAKVNSAASERQKQASNDEGRLTESPAAPEPQTSAPVPKAPETPKTPTSCSRCGAATIVSSIYCFRHSAPKVRLRARESIDDARCCAVTSAGEPCKRNRRDGRHTCSQHASSEERPNKSPGRSHGLPPD